MPVHQCLYYLQPRRCVVSAVKAGYDRLATKLQTTIKSFSNVNVYFLSNPETIKLGMLHIRNKPSKRTNSIIRNGFRLASRRYTPNNLLTKRLPHDVNTAFSPTPPEEKSKAYSRQLTSPSNLLTPLIVRLLQPISFRI